MFKNISIAWVFFGWLLSIQLVQAQVVDTLCIANLTATYHVDGWAGSTYVWEITNGTITAGVGTDSISVVWDPIVGTNTLSVVELSVNGCAGDTQRAEVLIIDPPSLSITVPTEICENEPFVLEASGGFNYVWNTGDTGAVLRTSVSTPTEFTVFSTTQCGSDTTSVIVTPQPLPEVEIQVNGKLDLCDGDRIELVATGNATIWSWENQGPLQRILVFEPGSYVLTGLLNGCVNIDSIQIEECKDVVVYNSFTPDGDGINDYLEFKKLELYPNAQLEIYNRWGDRVFESVGYQKPWDGTYQGEPLPVGSYYYIIDLKDGSQKQSGFINLIRR